MIFRLSYFMLFFFTCLYTNAQILKEPATLINPKNFTLMAGLENLAIAPVTKEADPLSSTQVCKCTSCSEILPVTLLDFTGERINDENTLVKWETTNEFQNTGFNIERSLGEPQMFSQIGFVAAQLNNSDKKKYQLNDPNNYAGISYYRLKQVDLDNKFTYSKIIAVKGYLVSASLKLYPNPAATNIVLDIYFPKTSNAKIWVLDVTQKLILVKDITCINGNNIINVPIKSISRGFYFIKVFNNDHILLNGNFIKQ